MRRIEVYTRREPAAAPTLVHLALLLTGVYSLLGLLGAIPALGCPMVPLAVVAGLVCLLLWFCHRIGFAWGLVCAAVCAAGWCALCAVYREDAAAQLSQALRVLVGGGKDTVPFTETALLASLLLPLLLYTLEFLMETHLLPYLLISVPMLFSPLGGIRLPMWAAAAGLAFQLCFWAMQAAGLRQKHADFALPNRSRLTALTGVSLAAMLGIAFLGAIPLARSHSDALYAPAYEAEGLLRRTATRLRGTHSAANGWINRGNNYPTGGVHLVVYATRRPTETLYLKGFSGGDYSEGQWLPDRDADIFARMAEEYRPLFRDIYGTAIPEGLDVARMLSETWSSMYHDLASRQGNPAEPLVLSFRNLTGGPDCIPYLANAGGFFEDSDAYFFQRYESQDLRIDWEEAQASWFRWVRDAYLRQSTLLDTQVPELSRLGALVRQAEDQGVNLHDPEAATEFILSALHERAGYSLTPGWTPPNADPIEYFLFDSGLGYCIHFASAAALLYRMCGIPARYASGYAAAPSDFTLQEDGTYRAVLTDADAHAWAEICLPDTGWTPVEATPSGGGTVRPSYRTETAVPVAPALSALSDASRTGEMRIGRFRPVLRFLPAALTAVPAVVLAYRIRRRRWASASCRVVFQRLLGMLRFSRVLPGCDGQEPDFPERLSRALPAVSYADARHLWEAVRSAAYGPRGVPAEEHAFARDLYARAAQAAQDRTPWWKRPLFRGVYGVPADPA